MKPVEQRGDSDCLVACLASILEVPYEEVPQEIAVFETQHNAMVAFLKARGLLTWTTGLWGTDTPFLKWGSQQIEWHFYPTGYWIAGVLSPRIVDENGEPGEHAVVMRGSKIAFDPHPRRDMGHLGFHSATVIMLGDQPALSRSTPTEDNG